MSAESRRALLRASSAADLLEPGAAEDGQGRVARIGRVGRGPLAQAEDGAASGGDQARMTAHSAETRRWPARRGGEVGFEPTKSFDSTLFKSAAINRSATSPRQGYRDAGSVPVMPRQATNSAGGTSTTTVPPIRSCQPRFRLSMKIQITPM